MQTEPTGWQPVATVPENGDEFWYWDGSRVRSGSLGHDLGGSIKRDPNMLAWHRKKQWYQPGAAKEQPPVPPSRPD